MIDTFSGFNVIFRRDTAANWAALNPILANGEPGFTSDIGVTGLFKIGDGSTPWVDLTYYSSVSLLPLPTPVPSSDAAITRFFIDCTTGPQVVDIRLYDNVSIFKTDATANTLTIVDSSGDFVGLDPLATQGEGAHLIKHGAMWFVE